MGIGKFITLEGIDGAGKSSHLDWIADFFRAEGKEVLVTREPGGTALGEQLRTILLNENGNMHMETETLLLFAARREHLARVIEPALTKGKWVLSDRFSDATYAYQGGGRGMDKHKLRLLEKWVQGDVQPDLTLLFDLPLAVARERLVTGGKILDRFEKERADFHEKVRFAYLERAQQHSARVRIIDGGKSQEQVKKQAEEIVTAFCKNLSRPI